MNFCKNFYASIVLVLFFFQCMVGCVFAPGMDLQESLFSGRVKVEGIDNPIEIQAITQELIQQIGQNKQHNTTSHLPDALIDRAPFLNKEYRIGVNDVLTIVAWGLPEIIGQGATTDQSPLLSRQVRADGTIFFPYAGVVNVAGKTRENVRLSITKSLSRYFKRPQVDVSVSSFQSKSVVLTGAFNRPGLQAITSVPLTLSQAIGAADGGLEEGDFSNLKLIRDGKEFSINYLELSKSSLDVHNLYLKNKDIVHLPLSHSNKAYVLGEVTKPQAIPLAAGKMTLTDALGTAGGMSQNLGSGNELYVFRGMNYQNNEALFDPQIFQLHAKNPASLLLASNFLVQPQDVIFVGPAELTKWNRVISQLFPFARLLDSVDNVTSR